MSDPVARLNAALEPDRLRAGRANTALSLVFALGLAACGGQTVGGESEGSGTLSLEEATIRGIHDAFASWRQPMLADRCLQRS